MSNRNRIMLFVLFIVVGIFRFGQTVHAEGEVKWPIAIDENNFPDVEFRNYLLQQDFGADKSLSITEMESVGKIFILDQNIASLEGIQYFKMLKELHCAYNRELTSLDVSQNTKLQSLDCDYTKISSLDVGQNVNLISLSCSNTGLSNLDVSQNTKLQSLDCDYTKISSLDLSQNKELTFLSCRGSTMKNFDISNHTRLQNLDCESADISRLDLSRNVNLEILNCNYTDISSLDLSQNIRLKTLYCNSTDISSLDVSKNVKLYWLSCNNTDISSLNLSQNTNLRGLNCSATNISSLDVSKAVRLENLKCKKTNINSLNLSQNTNMKELDCSFTDISSLDLSQNTRLEELSGNNTKLSNIDLSQNTKLHTYKLSNCETPVLLSSGNIIDLSQLSGFNTSKVGSIQNAALSGNKLIVDNPDEIVSYAYDCGCDYMEMFNLAVCWYEINYELNGGILIKENPNQYQTGDQLTFTSPERNGYTFVGWYKEETFLTQAAESLDTAEMNGPFTLYAKWEPIPEETTYAIAYHANGGIGQMAGGTAVRGKVFTLPQNGFTAPSGKRFKEWAIGSAGGSKVKAGGAYTFTTATTVYAVWEAIPEKVPEVPDVAEVKKASFKELQLKAKASKTSNRLTWKKVNGADGYLVYGAKRGKKLTELRAVTNRVGYTHKKLSKKTFYQYRVKAYRLVNGEKKVISVSQNIYSVTIGGKYDNPNKLTVNVSKLTLKKGKTKTIKAKLTATKGKKLKNFTKAFRYESTNPKIAAVSASGKIRAKKKGKCTVYVYAQNGISKKISVRVK